ncbi:RidA family protein [Streptomyces sp. NPDC003691]
MTDGHVFHHRIQPERDFGYAQAIRSGEVVHVSGQFSHDETGAFVHPDDFPAQLARTQANMDKVLAHYGATRNQIVSQTVYLVDLRENGAAASEGNRAYFGDHHPVSTVVGITALAFPGQAVEIAFIVDRTLPA